MFLWLILKGFLCVFYLNIKKKHISMFFSLFSNVSRETLEKYKIFGFYFLGILTVI